MGLKLGARKVLPLSSTKEHQFCGFFVVLFCFFKHEAWIKSSSTIQRLLALCSCSLTAENSRCRQCSTWRKHCTRSLLRSCRSWAFASVLRKAGGLFSWSNLDKCIADCCCCFLLFAYQRLFHSYCNDVFPTCWHWGTFFFSCFGPASMKCTVRLWLVIVHSWWAMHHCVDWVPMTEAPWDNVSFFTKLMVNIWSASSI